MSALGSSLPDFIASGYMIIARLVSKACLGQKIFEGLLNKISKVSRYLISLLVLLLIVGADYVGFLNFCFFLTGRFRKNAFRNKFNISLAVPE